MLMSAVLLKAKYMLYQNNIFLLYIVILLSYFVIHSNTIHFRFNILVMLVDNHSPTAISTKQCENFFKHSKLVSLNTQS